MFRYEYLSDLAFLKQIDLTKNKTQYVKIIIMNQRDEPITTVEGKATGGSISVNGASSIRRQGNLIMVASEETYNITNIDNLLSINKRVAIEIGFKNIWNNYLQYPIIWFPQGVFVLSQAVVTKNMNSFSISLTLKDKMTLLNGENGGILPCLITHHPMYNELEESEPVKVRDILYTLLTVYGGLPEEKILIDNVPLRIKNAMRLIKSAPLYSTGGYEKDFRFYTSKPESLSGFKKYEFNDNVGYCYTDFTYPAKELTSNPGETVTSVLDKIRNALGNYEYFFDINGVFRFQEIQNFINEGNPLDNWGDAINQKYLINTRDDVTTYEFEDTTLLTALSNTPLYSAIKNDIIIWGAHSDTKNSIRYHLVIDYKPEIDTEKEYAGVLYRLKDTKGAATGPYRFGPTSLATANPAKIQIYWNFNGEDINSETKSGGKAKLQENDWRLQEYMKIICEGKQDYLSLEIKEELPKLMNIDFAIRKPDGKDEDGNDKFFYYGENRSAWAHIIEIKDGQGNIIAQKPDTGAVTWYLDILDVNAVPSLEWMAITNIGRREKVLNDKSVNCLFAPNYQDIVIIEANGTSKVAELRYEARNENITQVSSDIWNMLSVGIHAYSAYDLLRSMLHEITGYNESISLTTVPIYHLEPNTRIYVNDNDTGIHGDYMIKTFSVPFTVGGAMTLSCQKAVERI